VGDCIVQLLGILNSQSRTEFIDTALSWFATARGWWRAKELVRLFEPALQRKGLNGIGIDYMLIGEIELYILIKHALMNLQAQVYSGWCLGLVKIYV
jgi:hypothetical protein